MVCRYGFCSIIVPDKHHHRDWKNSKKDNREKDSRWLPAWAAESGGKTEPDQPKKVIGVAF